MTYLLAALAGLAGAAAGWVIAAAAGSTIAGAMRVTDFEGARGVAAVWGFGPIGAAAGLCAGLWLVLRYVGGFASFGEIAWRGGAVTLALVAFGAAAVVVRLQTLPMLGGGRSLPPQLVFEIRVPAALALPAAQHDLKIELQTDRNTADALLTGPWPPAAGDVPDTRIVAGLVELYFRTSRRMIVAKLPDGRSLLFAPKLRAAPAGSPDFGDWRALDWVDDADAKQPRRPRADEAFAIRYRVRWPGAD
ncbi:MAG: hypothetical protein JNM29_03450 [Candidatus Odyssella sp.]|nr:hypothetical protein [Candidatus Odyssella sp.]